MLKLDQCYQNNDLCNILCRDVDVQRKNSPSRSKLIGFWELENFRHIKRGSPER